jgi:hypothetical protein
MKKIAVLLFCLCALFGSARPVQAGNVSWGFPLPFPFLFYKFGNKNCAQNTENGYAKDDGYSKESGYRATAARKCCGVPWWLQYRVEYDCDMRLGQTTSMPGVGGIRDQ